MRTISNRALQLGAAGYSVKANLSVRELALQVDQLGQAAQAARQSDQPETPGGRVPQ